MLLWAVGSFIGIIGAGGAAIGAGAARRDYDEAQERAEEEARIAWEQAQDAAQAAHDRASANLEASLGALGAHTTELGNQTVFGIDTGLGTDYDDVSTEYAYDTYDDWYNATKAEYDAAVEDGLETSWQDYLREKQMGELGDYGIKRAELELAVQLAERQFEIAEDMLDKSQQFVNRNWEAKANEAIRAHQTHQSAAGASGMRAGTAHETAREYQVARMEGLNLWREESLYQIEGKRKELDVKRDELAGMEQTGLAQLDNYLAQARSNYEMDVDDIYRGLGDVREGLDFELSAFTDMGRRRATWAGALEGWNIAANITKTFLGVIS